MGRGGLTTPLCMERAGVTEYDSVCMGRGGLFRPCLYTEGGVLCMPLSAGGGVLIKPLYMERGWGAEYDPFYRGTKPH